MRGKRKKFRIKIQKGTQKIKNRVMKATRDGGNKYLR